MLIFNFCSSCSYVNKYWVPPKRSLQLSPTSPSNLYRASTDQIGNARKRIPTIFFNAFSGLTIEHINFLRNIGFFMILLWCFYIKGPWYRKYRTSLPDSWLLVLPKLRYFMGQHTRCQVLGRTRGTTFGQKSYIELRIVTLRDIHDISSLCEV